MLILNLLQSFRWHVVPEKKTLFNLEGNRVPVEFVLEIYYAWLLMVKLNHFKKLGNRYRIFYHVKAISLRAWIVA